MFDLLLVSIASPSWPLAKVTSVASAANATFTTFRPDGTSSSTHATAEQWFEFSSGPPHCGLRSRIEYVGQSGVIEVSDPATDSLTKVIFTNNSLGKKCIITGPTPVPAAECINQFAQLGQQFTFVATRPCTPKSQETCDVWSMVHNATATATQPSFLTTATSYFFIHGTPRYANTFVRHTRRIALQYPLCTRKC